ncbi:DnaQ family exonuclease/DinG family helicase [Pontibacillus halophilus JSM 076056 = DSM 19796]|uniref:3'-5' exonuclease DinG n=1 Tax=Pontibacillus halophilus JSM 076056 = DSM 19796 TaxID=1385510 RepID=A0A0A5I8H0_9BACI|nr:ATP-dependent DNA helicase DinG [Pontibacillus halophilus]KGX92137.1 DnaQ family exonuclease/DinG family helicase [Pontibacillus halophilus JSM 076056 = DSM 19796]
MTKYVIVDIETTGHSPKKGDRIIEIGMVTIVDGIVTDQYQSFVNPGQPIPSFITQLTGIRDEDVEDAPYFEDVVKDILKRCQDAYFVAHHVQFDLNFLNAEVERTGHVPLHMKVLDTVELARILVPEAPGYKLSQLAEFLNVQHDDPHRALSDAAVTGDVLLQLLQRGEALPYETLNSLMDLERKLKSDWSEHLRNWMNQQAFTVEERDDLEIFRGIALRKPVSDEDEPHVSFEGFEPFLEDTLGENGFMSKHLSYYERREGQEEMAHCIYDAFQSHDHALIEAETGTGKSLAYLLPAIYESVKENERVMISTHTTQLQAQLLTSEIPRLQSVLPFNFKTALMKGKQHYLSLKKFEYELQTSGRDNYDVTLTKAMILVWLTQTTTGDSDEIQLPSSGQIFWRRVSAEAEGYLDPKSPWFSRSFYQRARKKAQQANLVITNHSLLCADLVSEHQLLPSYGKMIIDEAHHLETTAARYFGLKLDYVSFQYLLNEIGSDKPGDWMSSLHASYPEMSERHRKSDWEKLMIHMKEDADELFRYLFSYVSKKKQKDISLNDVGRYQYRYTINDEHKEAWQAVTEMSERVLFNVRDAITYLRRLKEWITAAESSEEAKRWTDDLSMYMDRMESVIDSIDQLLLEDHEHQVKWIEIEAHGAKNAVYLNSEPIEVASLLKDALFDKKESIVLTSATLTMKQSFSYIQKRLGLEEAASTKQIESPFNYKEQVQLFVPNDFPDIKGKDQEAFIYATCEAIYSLATVTKGRMLVLFTSYDMLRKTYSAIKEFMTQDEFVLIAQGISSGSRARLKKNFQSFDQSILFGTSSFWEGVDIPGEDLSSLVIVRLPFQPPDHPVYEAKAEALKEQGRNAFMDLSLPNAVIRFKQGFGRLIRSSTDRGIVFVCDDRIVTKKYGKYFTDSIPNVKVVHDSTHHLMNHAKDWL